MPRENALLRLTSRLIARRDALGKRLSRDLGSLREISEATGVGDNVDVAVDSANEEVSSQLAELESRELGQIEHALYRIAAGVYGRCEFCRGRISAIRLDALPYATSCIDCQRENERQGRLSTLDLDLKRWARVTEASIAEGENGVQTEFGDLKKSLTESASRLLISSSSGRR